MKVYEFTVRISSAYSDIEYVLGEDWLAEDLHKALVDRCQKEINVGKPTDFSVEFGNGGEINKVYDSESDDED